MALVEWNDELSLGIAEIDEQHHTLVDLLNELHQAIVEHHGTQTATAILKRLAEYTRIHFTVEESMMRMLGYPGYEEHKAIHEDLIDQVTKLAEKLESGRKSVNFELLHFLKLWLTKHIQESDREYAEHFLTHGVQRSYKRQGRWTDRILSRLWI